MKKKEATKLLAFINACTAADVYVNERGPKRAWKKCKNPDWMMELCRHLGIKVKGATPKKIRKNVRWKTIKIATRAYLKGCSEESPDTAQGDPL